MAESSVNLRLLMLAILLPIWNSLDLVAAGEVPTSPFDEIGIANIVLSGAVFLVGYYASRSRIRRSQTGRFP